MLLLNHITSVEQLCFQRRATAQTWVMVGKSGADIPNQFVIPNGNIFVSILIPRHRHFTRTFRCWTLHVRCFALMNIDICKTGYLSQTRVMLIISKDSRMLSKVTNSRKSSIQTISHSVCMAVLLVMGFNEPLACT